MLLLKLLLASFVLVSPVVVGFSWFFSQIGSDKGYCNDGLSPLPPECTFGLEDLRMGLWLVMVPSLITTFLWWLRESNRSLIYKGLGHIWIDSVKFGIANSLLGGLIAAIQMIAQGGPSKNLGEALFKLSVGLLGGLYLGIVSLAVPVFSPIWLWAMLWIKIQHQTASRQNQTHHNTP